MGNWAKQQEEAKEKKRKDNTRKEKLADFFFSLSNTVFGSLVIGVTLMLLQADQNYNENAVKVILAAGLVLFVVLVKAGNNILK